MATTPACRFYFSDFAVDTADLSNDEVGAYMRLLCHQWEHGLIPNSLQKRARVCRVGNKKMNSLWREIGRFFEPTKDGYLNPRMEEERRRQAAFSEKMRLAGAKGGLAKAASQAKAQAKASDVAEPYLSLSKIDIDIEEESISEASTSSGSPF